LRITPEKISTLAMNRKQRRTETKQAEAAGMPAGVDLDAIYAEAMEHQSAGRPDAALACFQKAAVMAPEFPQAHYNLGVAYTQARRNDDALKSFQKAVSLDPGFAQARANLGTALLEAGRYEDAVTALRSAAERAPNIAAVHNSLGAALKQQGLLNQAAAAYGAAIALAPGYAEALCNLAAVLCDMGELEKAQADCRKAIELSPSLAKAYNILGVILRDQGHPTDSETAFRTAIALAPREPEPYVNLGNLLTSQGQHDQPVLLCRQAASLAPDSVEAQNNLGTALYAAGRLDDAITCFRRAVTLRPDRAEGHFHLGMALLARGDMAPGWREYEWRWKIPRMAAVARRFEEPAWDGAPAPGKTLLIHAEQGLGDTLQFCRYATLAAERGLHVVLEVQKPLQRLLSGLTGPQTVIARGDALPHFDLQALMLSLPHLFGTVLETIPAAIPYLSADAGAVAAMQVRLDEVPKSGLRVGLVWAGNSYRYVADMAAVDRRRSIAPSRLAPLLAIPGVHFISLQKEGPPAPTEFGLTDIMHEIHDFADTAALVSNLDLVISVDTSVAHLAGALGKPVWLLNRFVTDFRWLTRGEDSPWYPTMKIFRQASPDAWDGVIAEAARELQNISAIPRT
jgi:tetratricopeptide (TPR) repeat protein